MKEFRALHRYAPMTARKGRLVADMIRGLDVNQAMELLQFSPKRSAAALLKVLRSAAANASQDEEVNVNRLYVSDVRADDGPLKHGRVMWRPGPQGRAMPYRKRQSHLTVIVREHEETEDGSAGKKRGKKKAKQTTKTAAATTSAD